MNRLLSLIAMAAIAVTSILMTGCAPIYQTKYSYIPPKSYRGQMCTNQCLSQKSSCQNNARMLNQACRMQANAVAEQAYRAYLKRMRKQNKTPRQNIGDFADYSGCNSSGGCETNYRQCFTSCGGRVIAHTVCVAFCNKANNRK